MDVDLCLPLIQEQLDEVLLLLLQDVLHLDECVQL
jgi:hypothetical protein